MLPMAFQKKQNVALVQRSQNARQVTRSSQGCSTRILESYPQLCGDNLRQRRLAKTRRAVQQTVVQRFVPADGSLHENCKVAPDLLLADKIVQPPRSDCGSRCISLRRSAGDSGRRWLLPPNVLVRSCCHWLLLRKQLQCVAHQLFHATVTGSPQLTDGVADLSLRVPQRPQGHFNVRQRAGFHRSSLCRNKVGILSIHDGTKLNQDTLGILLSDARCRCQQRRILLTDCFNKA